MGLNFRESFDFLVTEPLVFQSHLSMQVCTCMASVGKVGLHEVEELYDLDVCLEAILKAQQRDP